MSFTNGSTFTEEVFFKWLKAEFAALSGVMDKHSNFGSLHTAEAAFGLLERKGCNHFQNMGKRDFPIGADARDNLSMDTSAAAKCLAMKFWHDHGREAARMTTIERLAQVRPLFRMIVLFSSGASEIMLVFAFLRLVMPARLL